MITATFDNYDTSDLWRINSLDRGLGIGLKSRTSPRINKKGVQFLGTESYLLEIPMNFTLIDDINMKRHQLSKLLSVNEPKRLVFSDEPELFYLAFPRLDGTLAEIVNIGQGSLIWEVPDGVAYSINEYNYLNKKTDGSLAPAMTISNPGTEPMLLKLEAKFNSDNGFIGLANDSSRALIGDIEEVDGIVNPPSKLLFKKVFDNASGWFLNQGHLPPVMPNMQQAGTIASKQGDNGDYYTYPASYGAVAPNWGGVSLMKEIPTDTDGSLPLDWESTFNLDFNTVGAAPQDKPGQVGHNSVTFTDQNHKIIVSVVFEDNAAGAEKSDMAIYIRGQRLFDVRYTDRFYLAGHKGQNKAVRVSKIGSKITVEYTFGGVQQSFDFFEPDIRLRRVTWYAARFQNRPPIRNNTIRNLSVTRHYVQRYVDIPNKFKDGDILEYGRTGDNIYCRLNDIQALSLRDPASTLLYAPPGDSVMYVSVSSFARMPEIKLTGRAAYS